MKILTYLATSIFVLCIAYLILFTTFTPSHYMTHGTKVIDISLLLAVLFSGISLIMKVSKNNIDRKRIGRNI